MRLQIKRKNGCKMTAKNGAKIEIAEVARDISSIDGDLMPVMLVAGVVKKAKIKHSELGSGIVLSGSFEGWYMYSDHNALSSNTLTLPIELGSRIGKALKEAEKSEVKFSVKISAKKSDMLLQGYAWHTEWIVAPVPVGQIDVVRDMLNALLK